MPVLQLIYSKGHLEILNRQSALGSYIHCLCGILEGSGWSVFINSVAYREIAETPTHVSMVSAKGSGIRKLIPGFIKDIFRDRKLKKSNELLLEKCLQLKQKPDLILEFYTYGSSLAIQASKHFRVPFTLVYDAPVLEEYEFFHGRKLFGRNHIDRLQRSSVSGASAIVVYSESMKKYVSLLGAKSECILIHQNVDYTRFEFVDPRKFSNEMCIGFVGSFLKWHRVELLLAAFANLRNKGIYCKLLIVGGGMHDREIRDLVGKHAFSNSIEMTGYLDGEKLAMAKSRMHIGVMPGSNWYGAPNKIFEYGAAGMAVVAPNTPTINDLFGTNNEVKFFKQDNLSELTKGLEALLSDESIYYTLCYKLQERIRKDYSEENTKGFYLKLFSLAIS